MLSWQTVVNPFRQWDIVNAMLDSVRVDDGTGLINLGTFGFGMGRIASGSGEVTTVPIDDTDHWENGQWVIKWDDGRGRPAVLVDGRAHPAVGLRPAVVAPHPHPARRRCC